MPNTNFSQVWDHQYFAFQKQKHPLILLVSIVFFIICIGIYLYHTTDPTSYVLYPFFLVPYLLLIQKLRRDCVYDADKYVSLVYSRKGMLGYLAGLKDHSTQKDWYKMGFFWYLLGFPMSWCRFVRIRDLDKSSRKGD